MTHVKDSVADPDTLLKQTPDAEPILNVPSSAVCAVSYIAIIAADATGTQGQPGHFHRHPT
jgi:hypothetical protein